MERNTTQNKGEKLIDSLREQLKQADSMITGALDLAKQAEQDIIKHMTPKERKEKEAFDKKVSYLMSKGKIKEAQELRKKYLEKYTK